MKKMIKFNHDEKDNIFFKKNCKKWNMYMKTILERNNLKNEKNTNKVKVWEKTFKFHKILGLKKN